MSDQPARAGVAKEAHIMTLIDAPDPAHDLDAIEVRYQDGAHVAGAARTSAAWAAKAVADIGTLLGALVEARDDINEVIRERDQITEKMLADLDAARTALAAAEADRATARAKVERTRHVVEEAQAYIAAIKDGDMASCKALEAAVDRYEETDRD